MTKKVFSFYFGCVLFSLPFGKGWGWAFVSAQQTPQYTQFMLNNYGMNPAACGSSKNRIEALAGTRKQWVGFENSPATSFFNVTTYFGRKGGGVNHGWHGIGAYWQGDRMGEVIKTDDFYASYT